MNFKQLSDTELSEYIDTLYSGSEKEFEDYKAKKTFAEQYKEKCKDIQSKIIRKNKEINKVISMIDEKMYQEVYDKCFSVGLSLEKIGGELKILPSYFGDKNNLKKIKEQESSSLNFDYSTGFVRVILPELLPKRLKIDTYSKKIVNYTNYEALRGNFHQSFRKEDEQGNIPFYNERVVLHVVHFFTSEKEVMDADNLDLDPKIIIDTIANFMLIDDSMVYCSNYTEYAIGDYSHSEITIVPKSQWINYWVNHSTE